MKVEKGKEGILWRGKGPEPCLLFHKNGYAYGEGHNDSMNHPYPHLPPLPKKERKKKKKKPLEKHPLHFVHQNHFNGATSLRKQ